MNRSCWVVVVSVVVCCALSSAKAAHRVVLQGNGRLAIVEKDGEISWQMKWGGIHDIHVLPSGNIMVQQGSHLSVDG